MVVSVFLYLYDKIRNLFPATEKTTEILLCKTSGESFKSLSMRHSHNCTIRCDTTSRGHTFAHRLRFYYPQLYCHKQRAHIGHRHSVLSPLMTICRERGRVESLDELCVESFVLMRAFITSLGSQ